MLDAFLVYHHLDQPAAADLADSLAARGIELGRPVALWPGGFRLLPAVDAGLADCRHAVVLVTREFLKVAWQGKELDGLAARRRVVALLRGADEAEVARCSPRLAVAAYPASLAGRLERLLRTQRDGEGGGANGWSEHP